MRAPPRQSTHHRAEGSPRTRIIAAHEKSPRHARNNGSQDITSTAHAHQGSTRLTKPSSKSE